ncbi:hypothetical protein ORI20_13890 [Mycobacterium sp. CVI_P3]|uniref:Uncharacterized protein n=1 Tax=Mycobacterium pinniadriaticum TaxID=2994102 RepID=A0ABT3SFX2_9MYCO|nr:hypothetical protein [Mycobacterium pinniadriaticum]MCX2931371.1 hypothetical protein [Mycobacterium pinniadriaticum]MCX2937795.1 hypothetical protein [Mycobacterium pinniadriaticum]
MAKATGKDHAQVNLDIWGDDDWLDLTPPAQHLYFVLWTSPELSYCGCGPWHPGRISAKAKGWTPAAVEDAAVELSAELFLIIDTVTEEFDLRSWIKHDGLWRSPNMAVSMANARAALASRTLRGVVVHEVQKIKARNIAEATEEDPVSKSWQREAVKNLLSQTAVDPATLPPFTPTLTPPPTPGGTPIATPALTLSDGVGVNPSNNPGPTPAPAPISNSTGGYVSRERHLSVVPASEFPPPKTCPEFGKPTHPVRCGACADARRNREQWDIDQAAARAQAITDCDDCDDEGWRLGPDRLPLDDAIRCDHQPPQEAAAHA